MMEIICDCGKHITRNERISLQGDLHRAECLCGRTYLITRLNEDEKKKVKEHYDKEPVGN